MKRGGLWKLEGNKGNNILFLDDKFGKYIKITSLEDFFQFVEKIYKRTVLLSVVFSSKKEDVVLLNRKLEILRNFFCIPLSSLAVDLNGVTFNLIDFSSLNDIEVLRIIIDNRVGIYNNSLVFLDLKRYDSKLKAIYFEKLESFLRELQDILLSFEKLDEGEINRDILNDLRKKVIFFYLFLEGLKRNLSNNIGIKELEIVNYNNKLVVETLIQQIKQILSFLMGNLELLLTLLKEKNSKDIENSKNIEDLGLKLVILLKYFRKF